VPLAGDIEDTATNAVDAASRLRRIVVDLDGIVGIELMRAAQAIDLRLRDDFSRSLTLGRGSSTLFKKFRVRFRLGNASQRGPKKFAFSP
jgi:histidine ammonia-lyase